MRRYLPWAVCVALLTCIAARAVSVAEIALASPVGMPPIAVAPCTASPTYITATGTGTYTQPVNCNHLTAEVIGAGQNGGSKGGGGGGYSSSGFVSITPGLTIAYSNGLAPGGNTWVCNSTSNCASIVGTAVIAGANGAGTAPAGASTTGAIGTLKYAGGSGFSSSSGGGGGAAGPYGAGNNSTSSVGGSGDAGFGGAGGASLSSGANGTEMGGGLGGGGGGGYNSSTTPQTMGGTCGGGGGAGFFIGLGASGCIKLTPSN